MKFKNPFNKEAKKIVKSNVQALDKKQLQKVIGGADTDSTSTVRVVSPMAGGGR